MDIRIEGSANFSRVQQQLGVLRAQVSALNSELARTGVASAGVNPAGFRQMQSAMRASSATFRDAAASSGAFHTQQIRLNTATEDMTNRLNKQKVGLREMWKERSRLTQVYREQARLQSMYVRQAPSMDMGGRGRYDIAVPRQVSAELNTINSRLAFANTLVRSASTQMVNWGKNTQWAGRQLMVGFTMPMMVFGATAGVLAYQVDKEMTRIQKVYDTTAQVIEGDNSSMMRVEQELAEVRKASLNTAMNASKEYGAAAKDTLALQAELAATGLKGSALQSATDEAMRIATLGELDYQQAADTTIALQTAFKLSTTELTEAFNFMNATENATSLSIQDIAEATPRAASAMSALGVSVEEMTVLLVSMREAGVDAAEGANALKSATGTILAPSPAADKFIQQISNGQVQVSKLAEASGGNLYVALQLLSKEMNGLSKVAKQQILVKLFGKYQFNRVSAMLYNLGDAANGVGNQTKQAMDLMGNSSVENAQIAERELGRFQKSLSGRFKIGLETFKNQLMTMGEPFLEIGIFALRTLTFFGKLFNSLPGFAKKVLAFAAIGAALVGPITMLVGLFANFFGTIIKGLAWFASLGRAAGLVTKESKAMELASRQAASGWDRQTTAVQQLTRELEILTAAQMASQRSAMGLPQIAPRPGVANPVLNLPPVTGTGAVPYSAPASAMSNANPQQAAYLAAMGAQMQNNLRVQNDTTKAAAAEAQQRKNAQRFLAGSALQMGVMLSAMATMAISGNQEVDRWAGLALTASFIVPMFIMAGNALKQMVVNWRAHNAAQALAVAEQQALTAATVTTTGAQVGLNVALAEGALSGRALLLALTMSGPAATAAAAGVGAVSVATTAATGRMVGFRAAAAAAGTRVLGIAKGIGGLMGPIGWITTAVLGVGFLLWKHNKNVAEAIKQQVDTQKSLNSNALSWAATMGKVAGSYDKIQSVSARLGDPSQFDEAVKRYQDNETTEGKTANSFGDLKDEESQMQRAVSLFIDLQKEGGLSAEEAATNISAMYFATGSSMQQANDAGEELLSTIGDIKRNGTDWNDILTNASDDFANSYSDMMDAIDKNREKGDDVVTEAGSRYGKVFSQAFSTAATPEDAAAAFANLDEIAMKPWQDIFAKMSVEQAEWIKKTGIANAAALRSYAIDNDLQIEGQPYGMLDEQKNAYQDMIQDADAFTMALYKSVGQATGLGEEIYGAASFMDSLLASSKLLTFKEKNNEIKDIVASLKEMKEATSMDNDGRQTGLLDTILVSAAAETEKAAKERIEAYANSQLDHDITMSDDLIQKVVDGTLTFAQALRAARNQARLVVGEIKSINGALQLSNPFAALDWKDGKEILQSATKEMQEEMANNASQNFDNAMQSNLDALQNSWDARIKAQQAAQERETDALEARQDRETDRFEDRWDIRKQRVEDYWDSRIDKTEDAIEAEQKAEDIRQKIFEAEMTRLDRLNAAANRNIDFNVALNSGNFDEAAKIRNDAEAEFANTALEDAAAASGTGSENRRDRLQNKSEKLGSKKDEAMEALEKLEEAERESMEKRQEAERKHLDKLQEMRADSLKRQSEAAIEDRREQWELDKISFNQRLDLFKAFNGRNMEEILAWADKVGIEYDKFGDSRLKPMGKDWATYFKEELVKKIGKAGAEVASSKMWESMATDEAKAILKAFGFQSLGQLRKYSRTGVMPKGGKPNADTSKGQRDLSMGGGNGILRHTGGEINSSPGSRKGVARTQKGLGPGERLVTARDGEFMVNERSYKANSHLVNAINESNGRPIEQKIGTGGGPGAPGIASLVSSQMLIQGLKNTTINTYQQGEKKRKARAARLAANIDGPGGYYGASGNYSLPGVKPWVLEAANYLGGKFNISNIGGVGERATNSASDHPKGLALDFMTSDVGKGNALAAEAIRIYKDLDATYLIWRARINSFDSRGWMNYHHPSGATDPTSMHMDHVHISFSPTGDTGDLPVAKSTGPKGSGAMYRAADPGKGWRNSHDYANYYHSPLYAIADGVVKAEQLPPSSGSGQDPKAYPRGYGSYGVKSTLTTKGGDELIYAHLWPGTQVSGPVRAGQKIAESAATGNATGPHTHFTINGSYNAKEWFESRGIGLRTGGKTVGEGMTYLHDEEIVLTKPLTRNLEDAVKAFGQAGRNQMSARNKGAEATGQPFSWNQGSNNNGPTADYNRFDPALYNVNTFSDTGTVFGAQAAALAASYLNNNVGSMFDDSWFNKKNRTDTREKSENTINTATMNFDNSFGPNRYAEMKKFMEKSDVMGLTDYSGGGAARDKFSAWIQSQGWGMYLPKGDSPVIWNKTKYRAKRTGNVEFPSGRAGATSSMNYALLSGASRPFWAASAHTAAHTTRDGNWGKESRALQKKQYIVLRDRLDDMKKVAPIMLMGDFNEDVRHEDTMYKLLPGFTSNWNRGVEHNGPGTLRGRYIDQMFASKEFDLIGSQLMNIGGKHNAGSLAQYTLPGFKQGGFMTSEGLAYLHDDEAVTSKPLTQNLIEGAKHFANGGNTTYNLTVNASEGQSEDALIRAVFREADRRKGRLPRSRTE